MASPRNRPVCPTALKFVITGGVVSIIEAVADLFAGERIAGRVRRRVRGNHLDPVAAVGNQRGVEAVGLIGDFVLQQPPHGLAVAAQVEGIDQVIAIVIVRRPANGDGGAVFVGLEGPLDPASKEIVELWLGEGNAMFTVWFWEARRSAD